MPYLDLSTPLPLPVQMKGFILIRTVDVAATWELWKFDDYKCDGVTHKSAGLPGGFFDAAFHIIPAGICPSHIHPRWNLPLT